MATATPARPSTDARSSRFAQRLLGTLALLLLMALAPGQAAWGQPNETCIATGDGTWTGTATWFVATQTDGGGTPTLTDDEYEATGTACPGGFPGAGDRAVISNDLDGDGTPGSLGVLVGLDQSFTGPNALHSIVMENLGSNTTPSNRPTLQQDGNFGGSGGYSLETSSDIYIGDNAVIQLALQGTGAGGNLTVGGNLDLGDGAITVLRLADAVDGVRTPPPNDYSEAGILDVTGNVTLGDDSNVFIAEATSVLFAVGAFIAGGDVTLNSEAVLDLNADPQGAPAEIGGDFTNNGGTVDAVSASTFTFNGSGNQFISGSFTAGTNALPDVVIGAGSTTIANTDVVIDDDLIINSGGTFALDDDAPTYGGTEGNDGITGSLTLFGNLDDNNTTAGGFASNGQQTTFSGSSTVTSASGALVLGPVDVSGGGASVQLNDALTIAGKLEIFSGTGTPGTLTLSATPGDELTVDGDFTAGGNFNANGQTVTIDGTSTLRGLSGANAFAGLTITGASSVTLDTDTDVTGDLTAATGASITQTGGTLALTGSSPQQVTGTPFTLDALKIANTSTASPAVTFETDVTIEGGGTLTLTDGIVDPNGPNAMNGLVVASVDDGSNEEDAAVLLRGGSFLAVDSDDAFTVQRYLDEDGSTTLPPGEATGDASTGTLGDDAGFRLLSVPINGGTVTDGTVGTQGTIEARDLTDESDGNQLVVNVPVNSMLYTWDGAQGDPTGTNPPPNPNWTPGGPGTDLVSGEGFLLFFFDDNLDPIGGSGFTLSVNGPSNLAETTVQKDADQDSNFYVLGNPFPAAFDLNDFSVSSPTGAFNARYQVYDPYNGYQFFSTTVPTDPSVLGMWQGFVVERTTLGDPGDDVDFTFATAGTISDPSAFVKREDTTTKTTSESRKIELEVLFDPDDAGPEPGRRVDGSTQILFHPDANGGLDAFDASKLRPPLAGVYTTLSIAGQRPNGDPWAKVCDSQPLNVASELLFDLELESPGRDGTFIIRIAEADNIPGAVEVAIGDASNPTDGEILNLDGSNGYSFTFDGGTAGGSDLQAPKGGGRWVPAPGPMSVDGARRSRLAQGKSSLPVKQLRLRISPNGVLPVELDGLAARRDGQDVVLDWRTLSETNNAGFAIEQRRAGEQGFTEVGYVDGAGTTTEVQSYRFRVEGLDVGTHAFRLRQIDFDGTSTVSAEVEATVELDEAYVLRTPYPNPLRDRATVEFAVREAQRVTVAAYDALGRRVATLYDGTPQPNQVMKATLRAEGLASGVYFVRAQGEQFQATRRVTVVR
jgi:hypothetical protein